MHGHDEHQSDQRFPAVRKEEGILGSYERWQGKGSFRFIWNVFLCRQKKKKKERSETNMAKY